MSFVRSNGVVLQYREHGRAAAPALVLVNSLGTDARVWDAVIALLADDYRVISYDKRGHGMSEAPPGEYRIEDHAEDLRGLLDHLGIGRMVLCGVSIGGMVAQCFALQYPERLKALVLCDTAARMGDTAMWSARMALVREQGLEAASGKLIERWFTETFRQERVVETAGWRNMLARMPEAGYLGSCAALRDADFSARVGEIGVPTLVVVGEKDISSPPELVRETAARIPGARFEIIAGAGHLPSIDRPDELVRLLRDFLGDPTRR